MFDNTTSFVCSDIGQWNKKTIKMMTSEESDSLSTVPSEGHAEDVSGGFNDLLFIYIQWYQASEYP